ncbi:MAG: glycosyltransferase family 25 protein [Bacteroidales bacterium]|jgi:glycosyl transferase, family 25|nr:glycosyltransferase family 25 protein [Bacteroidales bacterium]
MSLYNDLFNCSYCINLEKRKDRWESVSAEFRKVGITIERIEAIYGSTLTECPNMLSRGEYGCLLSHIKAIEAGISSGAERFVIFEDDVVFSSMFNFLFDRWYLEIPLDWRVINFGVRNKMKPLEIGKHVRKLCQFWNAHAYAVKRVYAQELVNLLRVSQGSMDSVLSKFCDTGGVYGFSEMLVWQCPGYSDICEKETEGHNLDKIKNQW